MALEAGWEPVGRRGVRMRCASCELRVEELAARRRALSGLRGDRNWWRTLQRQTRAKLAAARERIKQLETEPVRQELAAARTELERQERRAARERERLQGQLERLRAKLAEARQERDAARAERERVKAENRYLRKHGYGKRSEKKKRGGKRGSEKKKPAASGADGDTPGADEDAPGAGRGRQPGTPTPPRKPRPPLPVRSERLDPPEEACRCPRCGREYQTHGSEQSDYIEIEVSAHTRRVKRTRKRPACECPEAGEVVAAPPPRLFRGTPYGVSVWCWYLLEAFYHQRPLRAVVRQFAVIGVRMPAGTLASAHERLLKLFAPLEAEIQRHQAAAALVHGDETRWTIHVLAEQGESPRCWLWVCLSADAVRFRIDPTRSAAAAEKLFGKIGLERKAVLVCDRYSAYRKLERECDGQFELAFCWAHVRRDFLDLGTRRPQWAAWSEEWVAGIGALYGLNRERLAAWDPAQPGAAQSVAFGRAQAQLAGAVQALFRQAGEELAALPEPPGKDSKEEDDPRRKPLQSLLNHRAGLEVFVGRCDVPLDNNAAERALRGPVVARKLSFGSFSETGARLRSCLWSVFGTLVLAGICPWRWMQAYLPVCAAFGAAPAARPWMPWGLDPARRRALAAPGQAPGPGGDVPSAPVKLLAAPGPNPGPAP